MNFCAKMWYYCKCKKKGEETKKLFFARKSKLFFYVCNIIFLAQKFKYDQNYIIPFLARKFKNKSSITLLTIVSYNSFWIFAPKTTIKCKNIDIFEKSRKLVCENGSSSFCSPFTRVLREFLSKVVWHFMTWNDGLQLQQH